MARPAHSPTEKTRAEVLALAGLGTRHSDIAKHINISEPTLGKFYRAELDSGAIKANSAVAKTLYNKAINGDSSACMFWLKCRAGWRETDRHEITGAGGAPLLPPIIQVVFGDGEEKKGDPAD